MLDDALKAYAKSDIELAMSIPARDRKLDGLNHEVTEKLTSLMQKRPDRITGYLDLIFIARHLERAGDHVKEIAEDIVFALAAEDIRHLGDQRPRSLDELLRKRTRVTIRAADSLPS
jgi:phosphate transport system protein